MPTEAEERGSTNAKLENIATVLTTVAIQIGTLIKDQHETAIKVATIQATVELAIVKVKADVDLKIAALEMQWSAIRAAQERRISDLEFARNILSWLVGILATCIIPSALYLIWMLLTHQLKLSQ